MKRHILFLLALIAFVLNSNAQTVVFQEDFDLTPFGVTCTSRGGSTLPQANPVPAGQWCWNDTSAVATSAPNSYHVATPLSSDTVVFESNSFSTVGNTFVQLSFFHKALMFGSMLAEVEVSNDNGATWTLLGGTQYLGSSSSYPVLGYFNITSYPINTSIWGTPAAPLPASQAAWKLEEFDVSTELGGTNGYANCKVRFTYRSNQGNILPPTIWNQFDGWFVDDVEVFAAPCEVTPPTVTFNLQPPPIPCYDNMPMGPIDTLNPKIGVDVTDPSGINEVRFKYKINGGIGTDHCPHPSGGNPDRYEY